MSRVALLCVDLLFGSRLVSALEAAGHEVTRFDAAAAALAASCDVLLVDLSADEFDAVGLARQVEGPATVGFYPHVDQELRRRALDAGYDAVVPRSRIAREAPAVIAAAMTS
jgi:hypothetical protein